MQQKYSKIRYIFFSNFFAKEVDLEIHIPISYSLTAWHYGLLNYGKKILNRNIIKVRQSEEG